MADKNAIVLEGLFPAEPWGRASSRDRAAAMRFARDSAEGLLKGQVRLGIGRDGKPLKAVKAASRPDGADGKPLDPHYGESRTVRWLRSSAGLATRGVTLWWSHGWGRILGYHAEGARLMRGGKAVGRLPVRDVRGLSPANERKLRAACRRWISLRVSPSRRERLRITSAVADLPKVARDLVAAKPYLASYLTRPSYTPRRPR